MSESPLRLIGVYSPKPGRSPPSQPCHIPLMATTSRELRTTADVHAFEHHWQDEADAAFLYRVLAGFEPDEKKKEIYLRLAEVEDRHVEVWAKLLAEHGRPPKRFRPTARTRLLATLGRFF